MSSCERIAKRGTPVQKGQEFAAWRESLIDPLDEPFSFLIMKMVTLKDNCHMIKEGFNKKKVMAHAAYEFLELSQRFPE